MLFLVWRLQVCLHDYRKSLPAFDSTNRTPRCCLLFSEEGSFLNEKVYGFSGIASSHASSLFTGAIFVDSRSSLVLKGETVFANNTAGYFGGKTVKCTL